jgi:surface glycoprotein (TIGR04207 family)
MTRNNSTYREQGRAVFLAAIMIVSVVGASMAFAGSAAATTPREKVGSTDFNTPDTANDNFDKLSDSIRYVGQSFNISFDTSGDNPWGDRGEVYLAEVDSTDDNSNPSSFGNVIPISNTSDLGPNTAGSSYIITEVDLDGVDSGTYVISNRSAVTGAAGFSEQFSVREQEFSVDIDPDSVNEFDNESKVELASNNRPLGVNASDNFAVTVRVTGPDGNALSNASVEQIFEMKAAPGSSPGVGVSEGELDDDAVDDIINTSANFLDDYDIEDDSITDLTDDGYVTIRFDRPASTIRSICRATLQIQMLTVMPARVCSRGLHTPTWSTVTTS